MNTRNDSDRSAERALEAAVALSMLLAGFAVAVAAGLVTGWAERHAGLAWAAASASVLLSVGLTLTARKRAATTPIGVAQNRCATHTEVVGRGASVDRRVDARASGSGTVVIAEAGANVNVGSANPQPAPTSRKGQLVVGELPGAPPAFIERVNVDQLAAVLARGRRATVVAVLTGSRGAGKTQLAAAYARRAVEQDVQLVAWVSAETPTSLLSGLGEVARAVGVEDPHGDATVSAARLRDALAARSKPAVLVLDNATDTDAVRRYLPGAGATRVIITSTDDSFATFGTEIDVGPFDRNQSLAYLATRTTLADPEGASLLAAELGDLPLALAQAATVIKQQGLSYAAYLERRRQLPPEPTASASVHPENEARTHAAPAKRRPSIVWLTTVSTVVAVAVGMFSIRNQLFPQQAGNAQAAVVSYQVGLGKICDDLNEADRERADNRKRLATQLARAQTTEAQRNAVLDSWNQVLARSQHDLGLLEGLNVPNELLTREQQTAAVWTRIVTRLQSFVQRLDAVTDRHDLLTAVDTLPATRTALDRDGVALTAGLTNLAATHCKLDRPTPIRTLTLPALPSETAGPKPGVEAPAPPETEPPARSRFVPPSAAAKPVTPSVTAPRLVPAEPLH